MKYFILFLMFFTPLCADDTKIKVALGVMNTAAISDGVTTIQAFNRGAEEANPLLPSNVPGIIAIKSAETVVLNFAMIEIHKKKPKLAFWMTIGIAAGYAALALHNSRIGNER